jgi:hypothetical protein
MKWHKISQDSGAARRPDTGGINIVFERNGNTVKRAAVAVAFPTSLDRKLGLSTDGLLNRSFFANCQVGVQSRVKFADAIQKKASKFDRRKLTPAEESANFGNRSESELRIRGLQKILSCRRKLPKVPILARIKATRNWFSERTVARLKRPYSTESPQQPPL